MAKEVVRRELLDRWSAIEQEDEDGDMEDFSSIHPIKRRRLRQLKEQWFSDAFNYLIYLPKEYHVWCGSWDLMGPLLETFYNYFKEEGHGSPLKLLWNRISVEMRFCSLCIQQHHQAQEMYEIEYEHNCVSPLLDVLRTLDEERISLHLKDLNARIGRGEYDSAQDYGEVVSVMFEVLMFPILLEDQFLTAEFQIFIEAIDNSHELTLDGCQKYPGVYALLFLKSRKVRSIGLRLAGNMGKLRKSTDLDPLQHLLKKCMLILEAEGVRPDLEASRPRIQLDRITIWIGMKTLLGYLDPLALEEGILDRYPIFLSIVLNNISDDSLEFSNAVNCLRLLFEKLGCKLWLRASLSSSVVRNTLLGQCFHTRNEKSHKEIFDLFQPFLQSLEALQDGEHEKQRRHLLFFLLHQVPVSSNFSVLMRKKACQIALFIVLRGYQMDPPCPPSECAHMWGPSLVASLKDPSLHSSLRQPALDLIQTIVVSDASALLSITLSGRLHPSDKTVQPTKYDDADNGEDILSFLHDEKDLGCWKEFTLQDKIISQVDGNWMCVPMLWFDVLVEIDPLVLPLSFSKAVFWALSRFSVIEPENNSEMSLYIRNWLSTCASEMSYLFGWRVPSGSDDGGDGAESRNSIRISSMCLPLLRTFKRLTAHYIVRMEQGQLKKQWTWEPMMSNSLILSLVDPNDSTRQVGRLILEQVSDVRGLTSGLQFLCSTLMSLSGVLAGFCHALKLAQLDSVISNFRSLHHLFFVLCKLLKEGNTSQKMSDASDASKFPLQGGFLKQSIFNSSPIDWDGSSSNVSPTVWKKFTCILSQVAWPTILKCLDGGKPFTDYSVSQMTCIRLLEVMPVIFGILPRSCGVTEPSDDLNWLHDLADWGRSSLAVVTRYWKQALASLLCIIKACCSNKSSLAIRDIEKLLSHEAPIDEVSKQVALLCVSLTDGSSGCQRTGVLSKNSHSRESLDRRTYSAEAFGTWLFHEAKGNIRDAEAPNKEQRDHVIVLSDEEKEPQVFVHTGLSHGWPRQSTYADNPAGTIGTVRTLDSLKKGFGVCNDSMVSRDISNQLGSSLSSNLVTQKINLGKMEVGRTVKSPIEAEPSSCIRSKPNTKDVRNKCVLSKDVLSSKNAADDIVCAKQCVAFTSQLSSHNRALPDMTSIRKSCNNLNETPISGDEVVREILNVTGDDTWQFSLFKLPKHQQALITKPSTSGRKRQVIQLTSPMKNRLGSLRVDGVRRFKRPCLDDWYRRILELDFFVIVGLASKADQDHKQVSKLKEVPICFQSPDEYVEIFMPLVLEEFKAQLQSSYQELVSAEEICCGHVYVLSVERIDDFHVVRFVQDENEASKSKSFVENDLVLLTRQPLQNSVLDVHAVGKVERREKDNKRRLNILAIRLYLQGCPRLNQTRKFLCERSKWYASRVMSITPQLREFQALSSVKEIPLLPVILNPVNHPCDQYEPRNNLSKLSEPLQQIFNSSYNSSQLQAINHAIGPFDLKDFELTLIQGPPGTGKTRTIVAIVSGLLAFSQTKDANRLRNSDLVCSKSPSTNQPISQTAAIARAWQDAALARQVNEDGEKKKKYTRCPTGARILICAQSNAAVDELVARISSEGLYDCDGVAYKPYLVRVGNAKTVHQNSLPFHIDTLVENRLGEEKRNASEKNNNGISVDSLRNNLEKLVDRIRHYEAMCANIQEGNSESNNMMGENSKVLSDAEVKEKLKNLYAKKKAVYADLANVQAAEKKASEEIRALRHKFRTAVLKEAEIIVTTLSGCGGDLYGVCSESTFGHKFGHSSENTLFDAVVIDEAGQALEPATLIPLQLLKSRGTKCIMVGDPKQLPATVLSNVASKYLFQCSMFERLQRAGCPVSMLMEQYRMHPEICRFPSSHFYESKLLNGDLMYAKDVPFHETWCLGPYVFFDIADGQERRGKNAAALSMYNECEVDAAVEVLRFFKKRYPIEFTGGRIGIVTPYKCQLSLLRSRFSHAFGPSISAEMEFNTVDGFQGREVDILLLSTVRAAGYSSETTNGNINSLGFVADVRRMNVALTRARLSLWIFGNAKTLQTNSNWAALLEDAKQRNLVVSGKKPYSSICRFELGNRTTSGNCSTSLQLAQGETKYANAECVAAQKNIVKHSSQRKRKFMGNESESLCISRGGPYRASQDLAKDAHKRVSDGRSSTSLKEVMPAVISKSDKVAKDVKSTLEANHVNTNISEVIGKHNHVVKLGVWRGKDADNMCHLANTAKVKVINQKYLKSVPNGMPHMECVEHDDQSLEIKAGTSFSERSFMDKDEKGDCNQVENLKDSATKRKQQREAVDALLSSALISSKTSTSSLNSSSIKSSVSTKVTLGHPIRPQKPRKDS